MATARQLDHIAPDDNRVNITPAMARKMLKEWHFAGQRKLRNYHARTFLLLMKIGEFQKDFPIDVAHCAENGRRYLLNGRHRLHALAQHNAPQRFTLIEHHCDTFNDVKQLYNKFDRHMRRTHEDALGAYDAEEILGLSRREIRTAAAAMTLLVTGFESALPSTSDVLALMQSSDVRFHLMEDWREEMQQYFEDIRGCAYPTIYNLHRQAVASVGFITYRYQPEKAHDFWLGLAMDDALGQKDPRKTLSRFLLSTPVRKVRLISYPRAVTVAWNAFYKGKQIAQIRVPSTTFGIDIAGTPHRPDQIVRYVDSSGNVRHDGVIV